MKVDCAAYYNDHPDYVALRSEGSDFYNQYIHEVRYWKNKYLSQLVKDVYIGSLCEVGCATGILLAEFPSATEPADRYGVDISLQNIQAAKSNYPEINFYAGSFDDFFTTGMPRTRFDLIVLSDILEHVEDDYGLLRQAGEHAHYVALNLPLEKCREFEGRKYGLQDKHGHLRAYDLDDAHYLMSRAGMTEVRALIKQYVLEPIFRKYLADKLFNKKSGLHRVEGIAQYLNEINDIELDPHYYKSNYFGLLRKH